MHVAIRSVIFVLSVGLTAYVANMAVKHYGERETRTRFLVMLLLCMWLVLESGAALYFLMREIYDRY